MYYTTIVPSCGSKNRIFGDRCKTSGGGGGAICRSKMCEWEGVRYRLRKCLSCAKLIYYFNKTMQWKEIFPGTKCKTSSCSTFWSRGQRFPGFFTPLLLLRQRHPFDFDFHVKLIWVATLVQMAEVILDPDWAAGAIVGSPICQENLHSPCPNCSWLGHTIWSKTSTFYKFTCNHQLVQDIWSMNFESCYWKCLANCSF